MPDSSTIKFPRTFWIWQLQHPHPEWSMITSVWNCSVGVFRRFPRLQILRELLEGDAFLKYMASIYVFVTEPSNKEGALHCARQQIVSNNTLFHSFGSAGLPAYVQSKPFSFKSWQPPNFRTSEEGNGKAETNRQRKENEQRLGDKVGPIVNSIYLLISSFSVD